MGQIKLSKDAALRAINYSQEASQFLMTNVNIMDSNVNSQFAGLQDPAYKKYLQLSYNMQATLKQICGRLDAITTYCQSVIRWIDQYSES